MLRWPPPPTPRRPGALAAVAQLVAVAAASAAAVTYAVRGEFLLAWLVWACAALAYWAAYGESIFRTAARWWERDRR